MLLDGQPQRVFQQHPRLCATLERQQQFPQQDSRHHPVAFFRHAKFIMRNRVGPTSFGGKRLRQAETEQLVIRLLSDENFKLLRASGHANRFSQLRAQPLQASSINTRTPVALSGPPRRTASVTISRTASSGSDGFPTISPSSESRMRRVTPSVQNR